MATFAVLLRFGYAATVAALAGWSAVVQFGLAAGSFAPIYSFLNSRVVPEETLPVPTKNATFSRPAFDWSNIDQTRMGACGMRKCFFRSITGTNSTSATPTAAHQEEGYLVAKQCAKDAKYDFLDRMMRTWEVVKNLEREVNLRHFLLEPPQKVGTPPKEDLAMLNSIAKAPGKKDENEQYYGNETSPMNLVIQKVKAAPSPALIPRCFFTSKGSEGRFFFDHNSASMDVFEGHVANKTEFLHTLQEELQDLMAVLINESRLFNDFQFLIDSKARIHHIDLDRIEQSGYKTPTKQAFKNCFNSIIANIIRIIDGDNQNTTKKWRNKKKREKII